LPAVAALGTVIVAEKVPELLAIIVAGVVATVFESNFIATLAFAVKPDPATVTVLPVAPEVGDNVTLAVEDTLMIADPVMVPSVADTVWLPAVVPEGIAKVALKVPDELVVMVAGFVATVLLSNFTVIVLLAPKAEPDTVTVVPTIPEVGDKVTIATTVNVADAVLVPSLAVTVWLPPEAVEGTVKEAVKLPVELEVTVEGFVVTLAPSNFIVMLVLLANFEPETVTTVPAGLLFGDSVIAAGDVTVNEARAVLAALSVATTL
jgi:hypothetical protein